MRMVKVMAGIVLLGVIALALHLRTPPKMTPLKIVYADGSNVTLWSSTAEVRQPVATVSFGDRLSVVDQAGEDVEVRTGAGATGWVEAEELLPSALWGRGRELARKAASMPIAALGHTAVTSNVHLEPGREMPRIDQFTSGVPVELLAREPMALERSAATEEEVSTAGQEPAKMEDWWLVLARTPNEGTVAGWVLGRFLDLDAPAPLPEYASAAGMRMVSWLVLNHVEDADGTEKPQYLVLGTKGPEGQVCDFTELRVYTWGVERHEYETAFIDGSLCGRLPVRLARSSSSASDLTFSFRDLNDGATDTQTYRMRQTIVRRIEPQGRPSPRKRSRAAAA